MIANFSNKNFVLIDQGMVSASNFLIGILLARHLGANDFGEYALWWMIVLFCSSVQLAFIISPMLTLAGKVRGYSISHFLSTMMIFHFSTVIILTIITACFFLFISIFFQSFDTEGKAFLILLVNAVFLFQDFQRRILIICNKYCKLLLVDGIAYISPIIIIYIISKNNGLDINLTLIIMAICFGISAMLALLFFEKTNIKRKYSILLFFKSFKISKWLTLSVVFQWFSSNAFILAAGTIMGSWAVGIIKIMQNTMGFLHVVFIALENILPQRFSEVFVNYGKKKMLKFFFVNLKYGLIGLLLVAIILLPFGSKLLEVLYGQNYSDYSYLLILFLVNYGLVYFSMLQKLFLRSIEDTSIVFITSVVTFFISTFIASTLVESYGLFGVVGGIILMQLIVVVLYGVRMSVKG